METVMIVEDEKLIRQGIKSMILRSGVPVLTIIECSNGQMALEVLKNQKVDVMFTDIRMPKMDGITLVREMQTLEQKPITVAVSGYDEFAYAVEMMRMGVREYILKPVDREQIISIMHKFEEEIIRQQEEKEAQRHISYQQLRYLCVTQQLPKVEEEVILKRYSADFFQEEYVVCCCNYEGEDYEQSKSYIYLKDVEEHHVFIVECDNKSFLLKNELLNYYVGFSQPVRGLENLRIAYLQASAMRKRAFATCKKELNYEEAVDGAYIRLHKEDKFSEEQAKQIETAVHILGTDRVKEAVDMMSDYTARVQTGEISMEIFEAMIQRFLMMTARNYENVLKVKEDDILELQKLYQYQTIKEYMETLKSWMIQFHDIISEEFDDYKNKQKVQQAISYIHENYNKDLNMAVVSNHISMNYSLFSYTFKQYTGKNFVTYLKELRIQEAKHLLETTDIRVMDISQAVGYENEKHFMKTFKAICGVSPTEYRKNILLKG